MSPGPFPYSHEQYGRLKELGAGEESLSLSFERAADRDRAFQRQEKILAREAKSGLVKAVLGASQPILAILEEKLGAALRSKGLSQVATPIIMSRSRLAKMGLENDALFSEQVFWLDARRCLRPMLAPHLYEYMLDLSRAVPGPFGIFEIGPCFRKESQGASHAAEFTMLNLVLVGLPEGDRREALEGMASVLMEAAGLSGWGLETAESGVYGETVDLVSPEGLELASCSMGPHPLDKAWGFSGTWVGLGLGLERLAMALKGSDQLSKVGRSLSCLYGYPLKI